MKCYKTTNPNTKSIEQEVNEIRIRIYEKTKDMTPEQIVEYYKQSTADVIRKYRLRVVASTDEKRPEPVAAPSRSAT